MFAAGLMVVVGCADGGGGGGSSGSSSGTGASETPTALPEVAFADVVNSLCEQRNAAIGGMQGDVFDHVTAFGVRDATTAFAVHSLGVVRDQIPYLREAPNAPLDWDALVDEYEQRADASNVAAGDGAAVAFAWYDPFRDLDARAYHLGATSCPRRLYDGTTRTSEQERYALAANAPCTDLMTGYVTVWFSSFGEFDFGPERLEPYPLSDDRVAEVSPVITDGWTAAEPVLRAIATTEADSATVAGLIDAIDTVMAVFSSGDIAGGKEALEGPAFEALDDTDLQRYGLLPCTFRDYL